MKDSIRPSSWNNFLIFYNIFLLLLLPVLFLSAIFSKRVRNGLLKRFTGCLQLKGKSVLLHASSLGEVKQAQTLVSMLKDRTSLPFVLSTFTASGYEFARYSNAFDEVLLTPYDLPCIIEQRLKGLQPELTIVVEDDVWLNLFNYLKKMDCRIISISSRLTERAFKNYTLVKGVMRRVFSSYERIFAVSRAVSERYSRLGVPSEKIREIGSLKYAGGTPPVDKEGLRDELKIDGDENIIVWGSFHRDEVGIILGLFDTLTKIGYRGPGHIVAPRYMSDCEYFAREFKKKGYGVEYRSDVKDDWDILILDTLGELASVYSIASLAVVGGTFSDRGGQNIMEPAFAKVPVIYGPDVRNFTMESEILSGNGGIMVDGVESLSGTIRYLIDNPDLRDELGSKAFSSSGKVEFNRITFLKEIDRWI